MAFTNATSKTHASLVRALAGKGGQTLTTAEIRALVQERVPEIGKNIQWLFPTDHCNNHAVKGACECSQTEDAPLSRVSRGLFRVR